MTVADRSDGESTGLDDFDRPDWYLYAACRGLGTELFYDDRGENGYRNARKVCAECPVRKPCLDHALATREKHGLWGGLSERERRRLRRQRRST